MTKTNNLFSLDAEIVEKLKTVSNKSGLVNDLLTDYFSKDSKIKEDILKLENELQDKKALLSKIIKDRNTISLDEKSFLEESITILNNGNKTYITNRYEAYKQIFKKDFITLEQFIKLIRRVNTNE